MTDFRIGVQVIIHENRSILLGLRYNRYGHGTWGLPGGHLEPGESFVAAAIREIREETSLSITSPRVFGIANDPSISGAHHVQIGLVAPCWSGKLALCEPDCCVEWRFCPLHALPSPLFPSSIPLINQYTRLQIQGRRSPASRLAHYRWLQKINSTWRTLKY